MIRNLKALGLALTAVLALGAVLASGASAQEPKGQLTVGGPEGSAILTGHEITEGSEALTAFGDGVRCPGSTYTGYKPLTQKETEKPEEKKHQPVTSGDTEITIVPDYKEAESNCKSEEGFPATIKTNGCDYDIRVGETTVINEKTVPHTYGAEFDITCPEGSDIEVHLYLGTSHGFEVCRLTVEPQTGLKGPDIVHNTEGDDIEITGTVENIVVTREGLCAPHETTNEGEFDINSTVTGDDAESEPVAVTVTDTVE